ncbi:MAG: hypothetical protein EOL87_06100 [Spartobacteria bacterium]|nr:hypothetical protein [Spartobacteria bacterium]
MRTFFTLWKKELAAYFLIPATYLIMVLFLVLMGFSVHFLLEMLAGGITDASILNILFGESIFFWIGMLISVPVITMRLIAEEKRMGTLECLLTAPVLEQTVILAKYAAALTFFVVMWIPTISYVFIMRYFDTSQLIYNGSFISSYLGTFLIGCFFIAMGLLASTITRNQIVAAILSFSMIAITFFAGFTPYITADPIVRRVSSAFSPIVHMMDFSRGIIDSRAVIFYITGTLFILFATIRIFETRKWKR